jgi:hypothetical protein
LKIAYGYTIEPHKSDPLVALAGKSLDEFAKAAVPGVWVVDMMPFREYSVDLEEKAKPLAVRYLPDWFPGTGFKRTARQWRATLTDLTERPYAFVKHQMAHGKHEPSFLSQLLESGELDYEETFVAKWSALSLYSGGADTVGFSLSEKISDWLTLPDRLIDVMLLLGNDSISRGSTQGTRRNRSKYRHSQASRIPGSPEPALHRRHRERSPSLAPCWAYGIATYDN